MKGRRSKLGSMLQTASTILLRLLIRKSQGLVNGYLTVKNIDYGEIIGGCCGFKEKASMSALDQQISFHAISSWIWKNNSVVGANPE